MKEMKFNNWIGAVAHELSLINNDNMGDDCMGWNIQVEDYNARNSVYLDDEEIDYEDY